MHEVPHFFRLTILARVEQLLAEVHEIRVVGTFDNGDLGLRHVECLAAFGTASVGCRLL